MTSLIFFPWTKDSNKTPGDPAELRLLPAMLMTLLNYAMAQGQDDIIDWNKGLKRLDLMLVGWSRKRRLTICFSLVDPDE